ncbi:MAG TPA: hypothetical protein PKW17_12680 [Smithellaceae bacterium]|nr:hypothetical protein [Smithellaceae bacterium]
MGLIVRDPALNNTPSGYASFRELSKSGHQAPSMGFHGSNGDVSRFVARFRVAKSFEGILLNDYTMDTVKGYSALFRVFLVWSAFERLMALIGKTSYTILPSLRAYAPAQNLQIMRKHDRQGIFLSFLIQHVNKKLKKELLAIQSGNSNNITFVAAAVRHIFAHGHLSAHADGSHPKDVDAICSILFKFHITVMDHEFSKMVKKYKMNLHNNQT